MEFDFTHRSNIDRSKWAKDFERMAREPWENEILAFLTDWFSEKDTFEIKTSGTTGPPKIELVSRDALIVSAKITIRSFHLKKGDTLLMCLPVKFVAGKMMLVRAIVGQMKLLALEPTANPVAELNKPIDFAAFTPHQLNNIIQLNPEKLIFIATAIIGGSPVSQKLQGHLKHIKTRFYETFGMSETLTHAAIKNLNGLNESNYFKVLKGFKIKTSNDHRLIIEAPHLKNSPLVTADIVELIDADTFRWLGRADDVINSGGLKLFPVLIEKKISSALDKTYFISKRYDEKLGEKIILIIESEPFSKSKLVSLKSKLNQLLDKFEVPKEIVFESAFIRNKNGKIIRPKVL